MTKQSRSARFRFMLSPHVLFVLVPIGLIAATWVWIEWRAFEAHARFVEGLANLQQSGEPVTAAEISALNPVADADNAVIPLRRAAARVPEFDKAINDEMDKYALIPPLSARERELLATQVTTMKEIEPDLIDAAGRTGAKWGIRFDGPMIDARYPDFNAQRQLANTVGYDIWLHLDRGDVAGAFSQSMLVLTLGRAMRHHPSVSGFLTSIGFDALVFDRLERITATGGIGSGEGKISRENVRAAIAVLGDERGFVESIGNALRGERVQMTEITELKMAGKLPWFNQHEDGIPQGLKRYVIRDAYWDADAQILVDTAKSIAAAQVPDWPSAQKLLPGDRQPVVGEPDQIVNIAHCRGCIGFHFRALATRRLARTGLALHLYAAEHNGHWPDSLALLVPNYLPALPMDSGGQSLRYTDDANDPRVYSVGLDGIDDGGREMSEVEQPQVRSVDRGDLVFKLLPRPKPIIPQPTSKEAGE